MRVRIVIPTKNHVTGVLSLLKAIERSNRTCCGMGVQVVVVDDSTDGALRGVSLPEGVDLRYSNSQGPAKARNLGAEGATSPILFLDDDCSIDVDFVSNVARSLQLIDRNTVVVGTVSPAAPLPGAGLTERYLHWLGFPQTPFKADNGEVITAASTNFLISPSIFESAGGFSELFKTPGGEDDEFFIRLRTVGVKLVHDEGLCVTHDNSIGLRRFCGRFYSYGVGHALLLRLDGPILCPYRLPYPSFSSILRNPLTYCKWVIDKVRSDFQGKYFTPIVLLWGGFSLLREICHDFGFIRGSRVHGSTERQ